MVSLFGVLAPCSLLGGLSSVGALAIEGVGAQVAPVQAQTPAPAPPPSLPDPGASALPQPSAPPTPTGPPTAPVPPAPLAPAPVMPPPAGTAPAPPVPLAAAPANNLELPPRDAPTISREEAPVPLRWPYFDVEYGGLELHNRYESYGIMWLHAGVYPWERLHLTARFGVAHADARERTEQSAPPGFSAASNADNLPGVYGNLGLGYVVSSGGSFVFAPGLTLHLSDNSDYGYGAGVMIPFVWVTRRGFRIGFEASLMRAFGGSVRYTCTATQVGAPCDAGEVREFNREPGAGFSAGFIVGYGVD